MFRIMRHPSYILIVLAVAVDKSYGVSVRPERDASELITASTVDETREQADERVTTVAFSFDRAKIDKSHDEYAGKNNDRKSDLKPTDNVDHKGKKTRIISGSFTGKDKLYNCCGGRFETSRRPESSPQFTTRVSEGNDRYQDRYGSQPDDRYGWQSSFRRPSGGSLYGNQGQPPNRYGSRPGHSSSGVNTEYGKPPTYPRPGGNRPYGYEESGSHEDGGFEISRPSGIYFSGSSRPTGSYGIYGTFGEQDEFPDVGGDRPPQPPSNIHTQKAVALKALAGVALIGAAAALAANPVLIPVGALAGRRRRSAQNMAPENLQFPYEFLRDHVPGIEEEVIAEKFLKMPECLARLTCEIQRHYITKMKNDEKLVKNAPILKQQFEKQIAKLVTIEMLNSEWIREGLQIHSRKIANDKFSNETCNIFECNLFAP